MDRYKCFGGPCCLVMEEAGSCLSGNTMLHPRRDNLDTHQPENLKSYSDTNHYLLLQKHNLIIIPAKGRLKQDRHICVLYFKHPSLLYTFQVIDKLIQDCSILNVAQATHFPYSSVLHKKPQRQVYLLLLYS